VILMKTKLIRLAGVALFSFACAPEVTLEQIQGPTQDTVDSVQGLGAISPEVFAELEASSAVFEAIPDANLFASLVASSLSQSTCITATATEAVVDVTYDCSDAILPLVGSSQIVVSFDDTTSLITFVSHAENLSVGGRLSTIDNTLAVQDFSVEGSLTHAASFPIGGVVLSRNAPVSVKLSEDRTQLILNSGSDKTIIQEDGVESINETWLDLALDKEQGLPVGGSIQPEGDSFSSISGGIACDFTQDLDGNIIVNSHNVDSGRQINDYAFTFQVDATGAVVLIPLD
jgi:hypothetical protein